MGCNQKNPSSQMLPFFVRFLEEEFPQELCLEITPEKLRQISAGRMPTNGRTPGQYTRSVGEEGRQDIV